MGIKKGTLTQNMRKAVAEEAKDFKSKFARAEEVLSPPAAAVEPPVPEPPLKIDEVVRESFSIPESEHGILHQTVMRMAKGADMLMNKSEVVRVGLQLVTRASEAEIAKILSGLDRPKTGRRKKKQ